MNWNRYFRQDAVCSTLENQNTILNFMHNKRNIIWNKSLNLHRKCRLKNIAASIKLICMSFCYQTILKCIEIFLLSSSLGIYPANYQWCSRKNSIQTWQIFKSKASFLLKKLEMKILWMVLQMIETQTLTTFLFVDTDDENGELSLQELSVFIKSEYWFT